MSTSIHVALSDLPAWLEAKAAALDSADFTVPLGEMRQVMGAATKENFLGSHDPDGNPWPPLKYRIGRPLIKTGAMLASLHAAGVGSIDELRASGLRYGTSIFYAGFHQRGTRTIPQRRFLGITAIMRDRFDQILRGYFQGLMHTTGVAR